MQATQKGPKACTTCAKAKARCIPRADGGEKCERCHRLKKDCFSRPPAPPRIKKRPKRSRVAELEKRLNELSSQFEGAQPQAGMTASASAPTGASVASAASAASPPLPSKTSEKSEMYSFDHLFPSPSPTGDESNEASGWSAADLKDLDSPWPLATEGELLLMAYREMFAHLYPFVPIPREMTSLELREQRPYLWKGVMASACIFDATRQVRMGEQLLADIGKGSMVDGTRSLDMLQAVQLLIGWWHFGLKSSQVTNMLFLARSMCVNLSSMSYGSQGEDAKYGPLDHLRAYAGTYYMNTVVFTTNKKPDLMMSTKQLENCCKVLESTMELESDEYLVKLVKVQQLVQTISTTMAGEAGPMSLPIMMVVQSFQDQLDTFRASLPEHLASSPTLLCHLSVGETLLKDFAISDDRCSPDKMQVTDRLQLLWSCVRSLKTFFEVRFAEPEVERPRFLILIASDLAYTLITGLKLLTLQVPGWELESLNAELPMSTVLGKQIDHITEVMARRKSGLLSPDRCDVEDPLERLVHLLRMAQAVVNMHVLQGGSPFAAIVNELSGDTFQDMVGGDASGWAIGEAQGLVNMAAQS